MSMRAAIDGGGRTRRLCGTGFGGGDGGWTASIGEREREKRERENREKTDLKKREKREKWWLGFFLEREDIYIYI